MASTATRAVRPADFSRTRERAFYILMSILAAVLVFVGFSRTYFLREYFGGPPLSTLKQVHGFIFTGWMVLLIVQVLLVAVRKVQWHRRLGVLGGVVAISMVIVGPVMAVDAARRGVSPPGAPPALVFMVVPMTDIVVFTALIAAGFLYRRKPDLHKRLMLLGTLSMMPAAIARFPFEFVATAGPLVYFGVTDLIIIGCAAYDAITRKRLHPAYLWGGLVVILSHPLRLIIGGTGAWMAFAQWITSL